MRRRLFKSGNSVVAFMPRVFLDSLNLGEGSEVSVRLDDERGVIIVAPVAGAVPGVDAQFARQVGEFIHEHRPALEALASGRPDDS